MGDENRLFRQFEANLRMTPATVSAVRNRYHAITRRINVDFWGTSSDTDHSWYAGSYGRGTAISTSDHDTSSSMLRTRGCTRSSFATMRSCSAAGGRGIRTP